jgi:hypothetical protein
MRTAYEAVADLWSEYGYQDAPTEVIRMLVNAIEIGYMAALNDIRDGDLDDEIRQWRPGLARAVAASTAAGLRRDSRVGNQSAALGRCSCIGQTGRSGPCDHRVEQITDALHAGAGWYRGELKIVLGHRDGRGTLGQQRQKPDDRLRPVSGAAVGQGQVEPFGVDTVAPLAVDRDVEAEVVPTRCSTLAAADEGVRESLPQRRFGPRQVQRPPGALGCTDVERLRHVTAFPFSRPCYGT